MLEPGTHTIRATYGSLPMVEGRYAVDVIAASTNKHFLVYAEEAASFSVEESDPFGSGLNYRQGNGSVFLPCKIDCQATTVSIIPQIMPKYTLLLLNYNNEHVLPLMFAYLRQNVDCQSAAFVMVDDGSTDQGVAVARKELAATPFAEAQIINRDHNGIVAALYTLVKEALNP